MLKSDRLVQLEKLWKNKERSIEWEATRWEPCEDTPFSLNNPDLLDEVVLEGYVFWYGGLRVDASCRDWDWLLLHVLHWWYLLPEDYDAPLFVNESAMAVCIPDPNWAYDLALLFQHPDSMLLGLDHMDAEKEAGEVAGRLRNIPPTSHDQVSGPTPVAKAQAIAFLTKEKSQ